MKIRILTAAFLGAALFATAGQAQQAPPPASPPLPYGPQITLDQAKKVAAAAEAESRKIGIPETFAIVGPTGLMVYFEKMDGTHNGSVLLARRKAETAAQFKRPSQAFENAVKAGNTFLLGLEGAMPVGGGVPIVVNGMIIGAIGASGAPASEPDGDVAQAGADALK
jgi:uncharacterized protein GlcG (DUF336 family)